MSCKIYNKIRKLFNTLMRLFRLWSLNISRQFGILSKIGIPDISRVLCIWNNYFNSLFVSLGKFQPSHRCPAASFLYGGSSSSLSVFINSAPSAANNFHKARTFRFGFCCGRLQLTGRSYTKQFFDILNSMSKAIKKH